jgi:hypothetical protein
MAKIRGGPPLLEENLPVASAAGIEFARSENVL